MTTSTVTAHMPIVDDDLAAQRFRVHRSAMTSPRIHAAEIERIFAKSWLYVGHESEIPNPGDFVRRPVGGPAIMCRQLSHLLAAADRANLTIQVLPFSCGAHSAHSGPFSVLEFPDRTDSEVAYAESVAGYIYLEKDRDVRVRSDAFNRLRAAALSPSASAELIAQAARDLA